MIKNFLLTGFLISLMITTLAQSEERCATMSNHEKMMAEDPSYAVNRERVEQQIQRVLNNPDLQRGGDVLTIPIVFHIVHNGDDIGSGPNLSEAQVLSQLDVLNEDFRRTNADASETLSDFVSVAGDAQIEFCLAITDPSGAPTNGIIRHDRPESDWASGIDEILKPATVWDSERYLNFWSVDFGGGGLLGYAQFPGGSPATDGVVIGYRYVGRFPDNPYAGDFNQGRTATHEVGHWLNLRHIWGDGACGTDDGVSDTPESDGSNYGCPLSHISCGDLDMVQNYMDYTDDACMNVFTQGQSDRMRAAVLGARSGLLNSFGCIKLEYFAYSGQVIDAETGEGVNEAQVLFAGEGFNLEVTTDSEGNFSIPSFLESSYTIYTAKWGYQTRQNPSTLITEESDPLVIEIDRGYYDDFVLDLGWNVTGDATTGMWTRGAPIAAEFDGSLSNPGLDLSFDYGSNAYVTGNSGGGAGADDVDDGTTTLTSPVFDLSDYNDPYLSYYRWFYTGGGAAGSIPPNDVITITLSNGSETAVLEEVNVDAPDLSEWVFNNIRIEDYMPATANMTLEIETADLLDGHIVDGGFDVFKVVDSISVQSGIEDELFDQLITIFPNPSDGLVSVLSNLSINGPVSIEVHNTLGQVLYSEETILKKQSTIDLRQLPSGIYYLNVLHQERRSVKKLIIH